jgi:hypothetical protein
MIPHNVLNKNHCHPVMRKKLVHKLQIQNDLQRLVGVSDSDPKGDFPTAVAMPHWPDGSRKICFFAVDERRPPGAISPLRRSIQGQLQSQ